MTNDNDLTNCRVIAAELDPERVAREIEWASAGVKGISYERMRGPVNDEPAAPATDPLDRQMRRQHREYRKAILAARVALEHALRIQDDVCARLNQETAARLVEMEKGAGTCANCGHVAEGTREDRIVKTRCSKRCYPYWRAHGEERPRELIEAGL